MVVGGVHLGAILPGGRRTVHQRRIRYDRTKEVPFLWGEAYEESVDRLIVIGCRPCGYYRSFHGLVQTEIDTGVPIVYEGGKVSNLSGTTGSRTRGRQKHGTGE